MAAATKKEGTIAEKLDALFELQKIDSEIDRIRTIRGELPLEVQSLEDEIIGLNTRVSKINEEIKEIETEIADRKIAVKEAEGAIAKYKEQQNKLTFIYRDKKTSYVYLQNNRSQHIDFY